MELKIPLEKHFLEGILETPRDPLGLVLFVHGSGSSRLSPRNQSVARFLQKGGLGTLLFDLLTQEEGGFDEQTSELRFNIPLLTERLLWTVRFIKKKFPQLPIGYFGASTGAAAALSAAAIEPDAVQAVVSRGGRPDLADGFFCQKLKLRPCSL